MEICFDDKEVERLFSDFDLMRKKTNKLITKKIKKRYDQLKAFDNFADFLTSPFGKPHALKGDKKGLYATSIDKNKRLILMPISKGRSMIELKKCHRLIIKGVEDYHGSKTTTYIP